jgi:hypothetical protein
MLLSILCGELHLLVSWCTGDMYGMTSNNEDRGRSRRPNVGNRGWSSIGWVLSGWTIETSGDVVCSLHRTQGDEERGFLSFASK